MGKFKCNYYHDICSKCIDWPAPQQIAEDHADDQCVRYDMAVSKERQEEVRKTGKCKYFMEF